jgi:hypothetical protein
MTLFGIAAILFGVLALALVVGGVALRGGGRKTAKATGTVVKLDMDTPDDGPTWLPTVRFQTPDGRSHDVRGYWAYAFKDAVVGTTMTIEYDPRSPSDARIAGDARATVAGPLLLGFGVLCGLAALGFAAAAHFSGL